MWPIAISSLLTFFILFQKVLQWFFFWLTLRITQRQWKTTLLKLGETPRDAWEGILKKSSSPYAAVILDALRHEEFDFQDALEASAKRLVRRLENGLGILDTIVTLAPMLGILGTVTGIISAFSLMGDSGAPNPTGIAAGIAEALFTTAAGLIVSIIALLPLNAGRVCHRAFTRSIQQAMTAVEHLTHQHVIE